MGYPYDELIPPAVLADNPGITKEEFLDLLNQTHSTTFTEFKMSDPWDSFDSDNSSLQTTFQKGMWGLAEVLNLRYSESFQHFQEPTRDKNGLFVQPPSLLVYSRKEQDQGSCRFEVEVHLKNIAKKSSVVEELSWDKLKEGNVWRDPMVGDMSGIVTKIIKETALTTTNDSSELEVEEDFDNEDCDNFPRYTYQMMITPFHPLYKTQRYPTEAALLDDWPQFCPEFMYNFSQERGHFGVTRGSRLFMWKQLEGKYYLDNETWDHIPATRDGLDFGYTDLILTCAAIRYKAWKLLSYRGDKFLGSFLQDFPEVRSIYEQAVWDGHTSIYAKRESMTNFDFLRLRARAL